MALLQQRLREDHPGRDERVMPIARRVHSSTSDTSTWWRNQKRSARLTIEAGMPPQSRARRCGR